MESRYVGSKILKGLSLRMLRANTWTGYGHGIHSPFLF